MSKRVRCLGAASLVLVMWTACENGTAVTDPELALDIVAEEAVTERRGFRGRYNRLIEAVRASGNQEAVDLLDVALEKQETARAARDGEGRGNGWAAMQEFREALTAAVTTAFPEWAQRMERNEGARGTRRERGAHGERLTNLAKAIEESDNAEAQALMADAIAARNAAADAREAGDPTAARELTMQSIHALRAASAAAFPDRPRFHRGEALGGDRPRGGRGFRRTN